LASLLLVSALLSGCQSDNAHNRPTATGSPTPTGKPSLVVLPEKIFVDLGPYAVGSIGCDNQTVAWTTSSQPRTSQLDVVRSVQLSDRSTRVLAQTTGGGTVNDDVVVSGQWVVFMQYQQHNEEFTTDFWKLQAVDISTKRLVPIAAGLQHPTTLELPFYSLSGHTVVWDELEADGRKVLKTLDLASGTSETLRLPTGTYPTRPKISGGQIVFLDNSTDSSRSTEDFYSRTGQLMLYDLATGRIRKLSSTPQAAQPDYHGSVVAWSGTSPDPQGPSVVPDVRLSPTDGKPFKIIAGLGDLPLVSDSFVIWYDHEQRALFAYSLESQRSVILTLASHKDLKAEYGLCGHMLFFALSPEVDGDKSRLRYVDLRDAFK